MRKLDGRGIIRPAPAILEARGLPAAQPRRASLPTQLKTITDDKEEIHHGQERHEAPRLHRPGGTEPEHRPFPPELHRQGTQEQARPRSELLSGRGQGSRKADTASAVSAFLQKRCCFLAKTAPFLEGTVKIDILDWQNYCKRTAQRPTWAAVPLRRTSVFACGETLGVGGIHCRRAFEITEGRRNPKKERHDLRRVFLFGRSVI